MEYDGLRLHYVHYGEGQDAVVFIHGWAGDSSFWRFQIPAFKKGRSLIVLDLPGHGQSDKPPIVYTQDLFAGAVNAVVVNAGIKSVVLVGHSMGMTVARQFIRKYPGKAKALVNVDGALYRMPKDQLKLRAWMKEKAAFADRFRGPDYQAFAGPFIDSLFVEQTPAQVRKEIKSVMLGTPQHVVVSALEALGDPMLWQEGAVRLPTLAIYAKTSDLSQDTRPYLGRLFPNLEYRQWEGCGHFLFMERPERFNKALLAFLAEHG
ncbi:MAG: alpha/beta hydrolase [Thermodesulfobacteriota bacterium]|nr:alpha/beta hydrolase [Thermodesulfobacteriota bacterium]